MAIERRNGALCPVATGNAIDLYLGVDGDNTQTVNHECPTVQEVNGGAASTPLLMGVFFSQANTITETEAGTMEVLSRINSTARFTPSTSLSQGQLIGYDIAYKDIRNFRGVLPTPADVNGITAPQNLEVAFVQQNNHFYEYDSGASAWSDKGASYSVPGRVDDVNSFIQFQITQSASVATFDFDAFAAAISTTMRRQTRPGEPIDLTPYMTNPTGSGVFVLLGQNNIEASEIVFNNTERTVTIGKDEISELYSFSFDFEQP